MQACRLSATDLACRRGERVLFRGLGMSLVPGEALQITGANGIGKSSLLRILAGLLPAYAGKVEREGTIGLIDEHPALDPHLPLGRALSFWADFDSIGFLARESICDRLGLGDLLDVPVGYLSTGQKKRAALARLIGQSAAVWLLDEPLNGLDRASVGLTEGLAAEHLAAGGICVIASHQNFTLAGMRQLALESHAP
jgi:heme exporter protein A